MSSLEALQDRLGNNIVFKMRFRIIGDTNPQNALIQAIRKTGAKISDFELEKIEKKTGYLIYAVTLFASGDEQIADVRRASEAIEGVEILEELDLAMESHRGGSCKMVAIHPIKSTTDFRKDALAVGAAIYADGRMMNNALAYPGIFHGAWDVQAQSITIEMMQAAAHALADNVSEDQLLPEMMAPTTHRAASEAVRKVPDGSN